MRKEKMNYDEKFLINYDETENEEENASKS